MNLKSTRLPTTLFIFTSLEGATRADRIGAVLSAICAVHCAVTPFLLLTLPTFGKFWAHPASHWIMALFVVPLAVFSLSSCYRQHRRKWIIAMGITGIVLVLAGAAAPSLKNTLNASAATAIGVAESTLEHECDSCCPSIESTANGGWRLHTPLASILTTIGSLFLIGTHVGNFCRCSQCSGENKEAKEG